jgi:hypothetical protein
MGDNNPPEDNNHPPPPEQPDIQHMGDNHSQEDNILGLEPKWALSQKGTKLLEDGDNYRYNVYRPITAGKIVSYRCQLHRSKKCPSVAYLCTETSKIIRINNSHNHLPSILRQKALAVEREYIRAAATVGKTSTIDVVARIRTTLQRSDDAAATSSMRKTKALTAAIRRQRIKVQGGGEPVAATLKEIHDNFPEKYASTAGNETFLRFNDYLDPETKQQLMLVFISDHGKWVLARSKELYVDGTFETCCEQFAQVNKLFYSF